MRTLRLALVTLASAAGGSALGAAFVALPPVLLGASGDAWFMGGVVFIVSLPFTLVGTALLAGLALLLRDSLSRRWSDYVGLSLIAIAAGALMPIPVFGAAGIFFGAIFAALTAALWTFLYSRFSVLGEARELGHG